MITSMLSRHTGYFSTLNSQIPIYPFELKETFKFLDHPLAIPVGVTLLSTIYLILHGIWNVVKKLKHRGSAAVLEASEEVESTSATTGSLSARQRLAEHVKCHGGSIIFGFKIIRLFNAAVLLALAALSPVLVRHQEFGRVDSSGWHEDFLIAVAQCASFAYALVLAMLSVVLGRKQSVPLAKHLNTIYLFFFAVYAYRDLLPLATFDEQPLDLNEGNLLWAKLSLLFLNAIAVPLLIPRQYIPVDPKNPSENPNPEQTASLLSLILYSFLDPIVFLAYRIPHLSHDLLPPLADYDYAHHLTANALPHIDSFTRGDKRHLFWGLMRVFRREYLILATMVTTQVIASFISPIGIKQLLNYLETGGEGAKYRPWVWISWLFIGPILGSIGWQWYIFIATRTLVRAECILTQLIFEHSLRIRMKAEVDTKSSPAVTPAESEDGGSDDGASETEGESNHGISASAVTDSSTVYSSTGEETVRASSSSVTSKGSKTSKSGKAKESDAQQPTDAGKKDGSSSADNLVGKINNLVTTDMGNIVEGRDFLLIAIYIPLQIALCTVFLYLVLGWSAFAGLASILLLFPIPGYVAKRVQTVQQERLKYTDSRVQTVTETMNVVRMIKLFGWEKKLSERIAEKREEELVWLWKKQMLELTNGNMNYAIPIITMIVTFSCHVRPQNHTVLQKEQLSASKVFSSMAVFDLLRDQLHMIFYCLTQCTTAKVSLDRVNEFLNNTELLDQFSENDPAKLLASTLPPNDERVGFRDATFIWSNDANGALTPSKRNFSLRIPGELAFKRGRINLIVGPTGSGKTSLLMALLGEMHFQPPSPQSWYNLPRSRGVAYAAQESWVLNETIKNNILFGSPYDEGRYKKVLYQCSLEKDLELFEAGDATEVGEKGLTLSGGQKARLTLARAVYSSAETLLLDDVLAALDVHTSKWIVEKCFKGDLLRGRTILLVTHNIAMTRPIASFSVSVGIDGVVEEQALEDIVEEAQIDEQQTVEDILDPQDNTQKVPVEVGKKADGKLIAAEEIAEGHVSMAALMLYFRGLGGSNSPLFFAIVLAGLFSVNLLATAQTWYLGYWASQYETHNPAEVNVAYYLSVYGSLMSIGVVIFCSSYVVYMYGVLRASRSIHQNLVDSVLGTTLRWLDTTPISRVLTRCTQDIRAVDGPVAFDLWWLSEMTAGMIIKFAAVIFLTPSFLLPGVLVALIGGWCGQVYIKAQLSVKREMSNAKAPVLGHFGAAIAGLTSLRAYGVQESFRNESLQRINRYTRAARIFYNLNRWICIRIDAVAGLFASGLAALLVYSKSNSALNTGFSVNMAVGFSGMILWWVRVLNQFEVEGNSLERIQGYIEIEQEPKATKEGVPPAYWPASGDLRVENLSAKYSSDGPRVLHDLSFHVQSGERIGVVGRTGSGKSSLTLSLLRCIFTEGQVIYDGIDTKSVNLDALRTNITIIPQIPELLSGSLRQNLDPFDQYDDATLNDALRAAGLFALQSEMDEGRITLDSAIASGGSNLSVGQRQILALARAIVRGSKLLILDEATSAIDFKTDSIIQTSLRNELGGDVTLITIAHRLQTIMDADKIMVLDAGRLVEFGKPSELLKNPEGKLRSLVDESGDRDLLYEMAK